MTEKNMLWDHFMKDSRIRQEKIKKYRGLLQYYLIDKIYNPNSNGVKLDDLGGDEIDRCIKKIEKNIELYKKYTKSN